MAVKQLAVKQLLKQIACLTSSGLVLPLVILYFLFGLVFGRSNLAFTGFSQLLSLLPGLTGVYVRRAFYQFALPDCGYDSCISFGTVISHPTAQIGKNSYIGVGCMLGDVTLESDVLIGSHVSIINGQRQHGTSRLDIPVREQPGEYPRITIGEDSWIGDRSVVMADIGKHCIVGAGSVVTKPVPDYAIVVGNPARIIRYREGAPVAPLEPVR